MAVNGYDIVRAQVVAVMPKYRWCERLTTFYLWGGMVLLIMMMWLDLNQGSVWVGYLGGVPVVLLIRWLFNRSLKVNCPFCSKSLKKWFFGRNPEYEPVHDEQPDMALLYKHGQCLHCETSFDQTLQVARVHAAVEAERAHRENLVVGESLSDWWQRQGLVWYRFLFIFQAWGPITCLLSALALAWFFKIDTIAVVGLLPLFTHGIQKVLSTVSYRCVRCHFNVLGPVKHMDSQTVASVDRYVLSYKCCPMCRLNWEKADHE